MFDFLRCKYPLPRQEFQDDIFQTRNLFCTSEIYLLTGGGRLVLPRYRPEGMKQINYGFMDLLYHGQFRFCTETRPPHPKLIAFEAQFWEGELQSIREIDGAVFI